MELLISLSKHFSAFTEKDQAAFDKWFGKSVVKDPEGNPLVVYHGTPKSFDTFDKKLLGMGNDQYGIGFYFTNHAPHTAHYSGLTGNTMPVYLKIAKPITYERQPRCTYTQAFKLATGLGRRHFDRFLADNFDVEFQGKASAMREYLEVYEGMDIIAAGNNIWNDIYEGEPNAYLFPQIFADTTKRDGIIAKVGTEFFYIVFSPTQIKSAIGNKGTFKPRTESIID